MIEYLWTQHSEWKMKYYGLSKQKVLGIIRRPDRVEKGIAGNGTIAVMQAVSPKIIDGKKVWRQEVWTMYLKKRKRRIQYKTDDALASNDTVARLQKNLFRNEHFTIISAWRYPGISPKNNPIPDDVLREMMENYKKA